MVPSKNRALTQDIARILRNLEEFVAGDTSAGVSVAQLLEALTAIHEWAWISRDALLDHIQSSREVRLQGASVTLADPGDVSVSSGVDASAIVADRSTLYLPDPDTSEDGYSAGAVIEVYPSQLWREQLIRRKNAIGREPSLVHTSVGDALLVSWALNGRLESAHVIAVPRRSLREPMAAVPKSDSAVLARVVDTQDMARVPEGVLAEQFESARQFVWTQEALYLDEPGAQSLAAKKLFRVFSQKEAERFLVSHLFDEDPGVRINVLNTLSMPAYSVGFAPGAPLPPRDARIEHVALQPETVAAIVDLGARETNQDVLDALVCTLSAQPFGGSLRLQAKSVSEMLLALVPQLQSDQSGRDARRILRDLRKVV